MRWETGFASKKKELLYTFFFLIVFIFFFIFEKSQFYDLVLVLKNSMNDLFSKKVEGVICT